MCTKFQKGLRLKVLKDVPSRCPDRYVYTSGIGFKALSPQNPKQHINYHSDFSDSIL